MSQSVEVVVAELHSASASLANAAQRLQDGLSSVNDETTELLESGWRGGAASAYAPVWQQWNDGARKVVEGLQRMSELLDIAGKEYAKTDQSAAGSVGSTMRGSGGSSSGPAGDSVSPTPSASPFATAGGASSGGAGSGTGENLGQALSSAAQLPLTAMQPLSQTGQAVAGLVQTAAQVATGIVARALDLEDTGTADADDERDPKPATSEEQRGPAPVESPRSADVDVERSEERRSE